MDRQKLLRFLGSRFAGTHTRYSGQSGNWSHTFRPLDESIGDSPYAIVITSNGKRRVFFDLDTIDIGNDDTISIYPVSGLKTSFWIKEIDSIEEADDKCSSCGHKLHYDACGPVCNCELYQALEAE